MRSNDATARGKAGPTRAVKASRSPSDAAGEEEHGPELRGFSESGVDVLFPCASARGRPLSVAQAWRRLAADKRSEEHTSELQSIMRISYADFCSKKKQSLNADTS